MSGDIPHPAFPSDETLAAFVDGRLRGEARQRVVEHVADCADCRDVVIFNREFAQSERGGEVRPFPMRQGVLLAVAAAIVAVIALAVVRIVVAHRENPGIAALAAAAPPYRASEGRIGAMPYQPMPPTYRGKNDSDDSPSWRAEAVAGKIRKDADANPTVANLHALGIASLTLGRPKDAVTSLESAIRKEQGAATIGDAISTSRDDDLLSDLSAAYLANGDAAKALLCAEHAWSIGRSAPAAWNRAAALTSLGMTERAAAAWRDYLVIDRTSQWAAEARARLKPL